MMKPWQDKIKECKIALEISPKADAIAWLSRGGSLTLPDVHGKMNQVAIDTSGPSAIGIDENQFDEPVNNENGAVEATLAVGSIVQQQPQNLPMVGNGESAGIDVLIQEQIPSNASKLSGFGPSIGRRRQSVAGGALFSVNNNIVEMGADFLRRMIAGTIVMNRFDPFQRMPNGPLRARSRSIDSFQPMCAINEVSEENDGNLQVAENNPN